MLLIMNSFNTSLMFALQNVYYIIIYILYNMYVYNEALIKKIGRAVKK